VEELLTIWISLLYDLSEAGDTYQKYSRDHVFTVLMFIHAPGILQLE
jgi:hypothetical protein